MFLNFFDYQKQIFQHISAHSENINWSNYQVLKLITAKVKSINNINIIFEPSNNDAIDLIAKTNTIFKHDYLSDEMFQVKILNVMFRLNSTKILIQMKSQKEFQKSIIQILMNQQTELYI